MLAGCRAADVVFTSGGTEANNLVLSAFDRVITCAVEHDSVLQAAPDATVIGVDGQGRIDLDALRQAVDEVPETARGSTLVSVMTANNETGVLQPIEEVVSIARNAGLATHSDMVQMLGKQHLDFDGLGLDYASLSAHKIGGPSGVGSLLVKPDNALTSLLRGGGQEQGRRSGTENFVGIAGFGAAATAAFGDVAHYQAMSKWRNQFEVMMRENVAEVSFFGQQAERVGNTSCVAIAGKSAETMVMALDIAGVAISAGSACSSGKVKASHVLAAMGAGDLAGQAVRISGGWQTKQSDFERLADVFLGLYKR